MGTYTGPDTGVGTDWIDRYGMGSQVWDKELASFNAVRDAALQQIMGQSPQLGSMMMGGLPNAGQAYGQTPSQAVAQRANPQMYPDADLIAAAKYWGMSEAQAAQVPRDQLTAWIQQQRTAMRPSEATFMDRLSDIPKMLAAGPVEFGIGAAEAITGGLQRLPIIGEALSRNENLHNADMWLRSMDEAVKAQTPESFQWVNRAANVGGSLYGLFYPATAAWKIAGAAGRLAPLAWAGKLITSPIARAGIQGAASGVMLEGRGLFDSDDPNHWNALIAAGAGGVLGAGGEALMPLIAKSLPGIRAGIQRVVQRFGGGLGEEGGTQPDIAKWLSGQTGQLGPQLPPMGSPAEQLMAMRESASPETRQSIDAMLQHMGVNPQLQEINVSTAPGFTGTGASALENQAAARSVPGMEIPMQPGITTETAPLVAGELNKASTVIESPALPEVAVSPQIDEASVARAAASTNPGGTNVIEGVADPVGFAQSVLEQLPDSHVAFAQRPRSSRLDALVSDKPISAANVAEYEVHGMYSGQRTMLPNGTEAEITGIHGTMASARPIYGGVEQFFPLEDLSPYVNSTASLEVPQMWKAFSQYADQRVAAVSDAMGGTMSPERLQQLRNDGLAKYIDEFLDDTGIAAAGDRSRIKAYFNQQWVVENKAYDPVSAQYASEVQQRAAELSSTVEHSPQARLDNLATTKGFRAVPTGNGSWTVVDEVGQAGGIPNSRATPTQILFSDQGAAEEWLRRMNRELPDVSPASEVPGEVAGELPHSVPQEPNLRNDQYETQTMEAIDDAAEALGDREDGSAEAWAASAKQQAQDAAANGNWGRLTNVWNDLVGRWRPSRARFARFQDELKANGLDLNIFDDWDTLSNGRDLRHNWSNQWHDRWSDIMYNFRREDLRSGLVTQVYEIEDDAARIAAAQKAGFTPRQIGAFGEMEQFFRDIFPETGIDQARELRRYISHVQARQSAFGSVAPATFDMPGLSPDFSFFAEHVRTGNLNLREMDARNLGNIYINALGFKRFMADDWTRIIGKWNAISQQVPELDGVTNVFQNWARLIRYGYQPGNDATLTAVHSAINLLIPGISKQEARQIFNMGLTTTHSALLGFRPDVWARDSIQLLLALPRAGNDLLDTMMQYARGGQAGRKAIWDKALEHGWVQMGMPRIAAPGIGEGTQAALPPGSLVPEGTDLGQMAREAATGNQQNWRYQLMQKTADAIWDAMPAAAHNLQDTPFHPLYFYTKEGERMRLITGYAGYQRALRAITDFRAAGENGSLDQLMGDSAARTFWPAVQDKFKQLVAAGQDDAAAGFLGRQLADATQFRYGTPESPEALRSTAGRMWMQMGNFGFQFWQYIQESLRNGTLGDKAKFLSLMGATGYALNAATKATGWNFNKWQYAGSLMFTGGPWMNVLANAYEGMQGVTGMAQSAQAPYEYGGQSQLNAASQGLTSAAGSALEMLNPAAGLLRTIGGVRSLSDSPHPWAAFGRLLLTGERGARPDVIQGIQQALPPVSFPTGPGPQVQSSASTYSTATPPPAVPAPGGQPYAYRHNPVVAYAPPQTFQDTLHYLVGGLPVIQSRPMPDGVYGTYTPVQPAFHIGQDTAYINSAPQSVPVPADYSLAHEVGHRLYYSNERLRSAATPLDPATPALQQIIQAMHNRAQYGNLNEGEGFAQTFAQALERVRGSNYVPPAGVGPSPNPSDVTAMQDWMQAKLRAWPNSGAGGAQF